MLERERQYIDQITKELDRWERGEIEYRYQHKQLSVQILNALILKKQQLARLMDKPRMPKVEAELDQLTQDHNAWVDVNNRVTELTERVNQEAAGKFGGIDLDAVPSFSNGWETMPKNKDGHQSVVRICCKCGAGHLYEHRIRRNKVEYRSYSLENDDAETRKANGAGAQKAAAPAGDGRPETRTRRAGSAVTG